MRPHSNELGPDTRANAANLHSWSGTTHLGATWRRGLKPSRCVAARNDHSMESTPGRAALALTDPSSRVSLEHTSRARRGLGSRSSFAMTMRVSRETAASGWISDTGERQRQQEWSGPNGATVSRETRWARALPGPHVSGATTGNQVTLQRSAAK